MNRVQTSILALSLSALPLAAPAQVTSEQILSCSADRTGEGCSELLTRVFVCERAEAMNGCAEVLQAQADALASLESATEEEVEEAEDAAEDAEAAEDAAEAGNAPEDDDEFVSDTEEEFDVEVRAEGEASDEAGPDADEPGATEEDAETEGGDDADDSDEADDGDEEEVILPRQN